MAIVNRTPDSFYDGGRHNDISALPRQVTAMLEAGAAIIDVGGMSTRPNAEEVDEEEELRRVVPAIAAIAAEFPEAIISVDTVKARVAREAVAAGARMVNDVSAGRMDEALLETVALLGVPYVLMHMRGTPKTMQSDPLYEDVVGEVLDFFIRETGKLRQLGIKDIIIDPGFGFGKTLAHNYTLLRKLSVFQILELPIMAGLSRKSIVSRPLGVDAAGALNGSTALHMVALLNGASILRAHDVRAARETIQLFKLLNA
jgi:dihydropteroate synthase